MLAIDEVDNRTGYVQVPGQKAPATQEYPEYKRANLPYRLLYRVTGADIYEGQAFLAIVGTQVVSQESITNISVFIDETARRHADVLEPAAETLPIARSSHENHEIAQAASRLRELSGLDVESLAAIFDVSRVTYHRWLKGFPPKRRHHDAVLMVLPLLEEAAQRLGSPAAVATWLLTPVSAGGKKPLAYLTEKRYDLFRGFLLRQSTGKGQFRPLKPSRRVFKPRTREEIEDVREQLRPHTWYDKEYDSGNSDEE